VLTVAFDTGPLHGPATGIARATSGLQQALEADGSVRLAPYVLSFRAALAPNVRRLPLPARPALELWSRLARPRVDRRWSDVDLVHGTNYVVPPSRRPRVVSVYDCWALENPDRVHADVRAAMRVLRRSIDDGAFVHASSHATATRLRDLFPGVDVTVVHLGDITPVTTDTASPAEVPAELEAGAPFVLALGTRERRKNLPLLIKAFAAVSSDHSDAHLVLAGGPGDDDPRIEAALSDLSQMTRRRIHLVGRVSDSTASWLLDRAALLAYPSLDEGFGFPLLEAMGHRTPIVAAAVGSIPEVAGDAALLVDVHDADSWSSALSRVLDDVSLADELRDRGTERRRQFSWDRTAREMIDLYRRVVGLGS